MKKSSFIILGFFLVIGLKAQKDSLRKFRLSGIQVDIGPTFYPDYKSRSLEELRKIVKNDPYLNADLSSYTRQQYYVFNSVFNGLISVKGYLTINDKSKLKKELFFGLKYGQEGNTGIYYTKNTYDTVLTYTDPSSGIKFNEISRKESDYAFVYTSEKLIVPLGINIVTDKSKRFWVSMGIELAPVVNFNYVLTSTQGEGHTEDVVQEGDTINNTYFNSNHTGHYDATQTRTKIKGMGYGLYASLPFTMYLHPFKRTTFLKHLNLLASITPLYMYSYNKYFGSASGVTISLATGIRYNW